MIRGYQKYLSPLKRYTHCIYTPTCSQYAIEALEKQIAKRPYYEGDGYDPEGELIYDTWRCPNCDKAYEVDYDEYDYCPNCGQRIDWSEEDDKQGDRKANKGNDEAE